MMNELMKPYPGEDEISFAKRKAYFYRFVKPRLEYGWRDSIEKKSEHLKPITADEKREIDAFWGQFLAPAIRERFIDYLFYDFYNSVRKSDERLCCYLPDSFHQPFIDDYFTNPQHSFPCDDKNMYYLYFHDVNRPVTVFHKYNGLFHDKNYVRISLAEAVRKAKDCGEVILKKGKFSMGGKGITFWNAETDDVSKLSEFLLDSDAVVCQELIKQHESTAKINPSSVNTLRIMTLLFNDDIHVLSSVFRMGVNGSRVDNASSGGIVCGVNPNGRLKDMAFTPSGQKFMKHPGGMSFEDVIIPCYEKCVNLAVSLAGRFSNLSRLISWDMAIDQSGHPMLIEFNLTVGEMDFHQLCNGPLYGDMTEDVLTEVFKNSYTLNSILKSLL